MSRLDPTVWAGEPEVSGVDGLLIDLPHRGNRLVIACRHCCHKADISGRYTCNNGGPDLRPTSDLHSESGAPL